MLSRKTPRDVESEMQFWMARMRSWQALLAEAILGVVVLVILLLVVFDRPTAPLGSILHTAVASFAAVFVHHSVRRPK